MPTRSTVPRTTAGRWLAGALLITFTAHTVATTPSWFFASGPHVLAGALMVGGSVWLCSRAYRRARARTEGACDRYRNLSAAVRQQRYGGWRTVYNRYQRRGPAAPVRGRDGRFKGSRRRR